MRTRTANQVVHRFTAQLVQSAGRVWQRVSQPSVELCPAEPSAPNRADLGLAGAAPILQRILLDNVMPFWLREAGDPAAGGFRLNHDVRGRWRGAAPKRVVTQARTLWFLARLMGQGGAAPEVPILAAQGLRFLAERLWDARCGGFYWEVDADGQQATMSDKQAYGQAQALYALCQLALACDCADAGRLARATFDVLEQHFHDREHGGYHEFLRADLSAPRPGRPGYLGAPPECKLMNTHLHLMEALTLFYRLTQDAMAGARLLELADIVGATVVHPRHGTCLDRHRSDWTPLGDGRHCRTSYGHDLEAIHLLMAADEVLGLAPARRLDLFFRLFEHAVRCGEDPILGGFFAAGIPGMPAADRRKIWWVQAEALLGALELYRLSGEQACADVFLRTLEWLRRWQVDWQAGEWHAEIVGDRAFGLKAGPWKGPYHNGRALIQGHEVLSWIA